MSGPYWPVSRRSNSAAAAVRSTRRGSSVIMAGFGLEEAEGLRRVADQEILGLLVVVQHHLVGLAADAGLLVAAEGRVRRVGVVAVRPHPARLDLPARPVSPGAIPGPYARAQAVQGVVGDLESVGFV